MKLKTVTFTGADDSVLPKDIVELSQEYPFVEWGILLSEKQEGSKRFPSRAWMDRLADAVSDHGLMDSVMLAGHLCGKWVRKLAQGVFTFPLDHERIWGHLGRLQLNFHAEEILPDPTAFMTMVQAIGKSGRKTIFQIDGRNNKLFEMAQVWDAPVVAPLFDMSHGAGVRPEAWPSPIHNYCGYAGGLGPENIEEELKRIADVAGETPIWIDMETRVRSDHDRQFDLVKVRRVLEIVAPFVEGHNHAEGLR